MCSRNQLLLLKRNKTKPELFSFSEAPSHLHLGISTTTKWAGILMEAEPSRIFFTKKILGCFHFPPMSSHPPDNAIALSSSLSHFPPLSFTAFLPLVLHWKPRSFSSLLSSLLEATTTAALVKRCYLKPSSSLMLCKGIINHARKRKQGSCGFN